MQRRHLVVSLTLGASIAAVGSFVGCGEIATIEPPDGSAPSTAQDGSSTNGNGEDTSTTTTSDGSATGTDGAPNKDGSTNVDGGGTLLDGASDATACTACQPDFCGCGQCTRDEIVCTKTPSICPIACATSCDLSTVKCGCVEDRCVSITPPPDPVPCYTTADCPPTTCCKKGALDRRGVCQAGTNCP